MQADFKTPIAKLRKDFSEPRRADVIGHIVRVAGSRTLDGGLEDLDGTPVINLSQVPLQGWSSLVKRGMDLGLASVAMVVLLPFLPVVALALVRHGRIVPEQLLALVHPDHTVVLSEE